MTTTSELRAQADRFRWFHRIDLGHGVVTRGEDETQRKLATIRVPARLDGWSVLDIGAWDGFFSFEAERRGAARVVAVDPACWREPAWGPDGWGTKRPFEFARQALGSSVPGHRPRTAGDLARVGWRVRPGAVPRRLLPPADPWLIVRRAASVAAADDRRDARRPAGAAAPAMAFIRRGRRVRRTGGARPCSKRCCRTRASRASSCSARIASGDSRVRQSGASSAGRTVTSGVAWWHTGGAEAPTDRYGYGCRFPVRQGTARDPQLTCPLIYKTDRRRV